MTGAHNMTITAGDIAPNFTLLDSDSNELIYLISMVVGKLFSSMPKMAHQLAKEDV